MNGGKSPCTRSHYYIIIIASLQKKIGHTSLLLIFFLQFEISKEQRQTQGIFDISE